MAESSPQRSVIAVVTVQSVSIQLRNTRLRDSTTGLLAEIVSPSCGVAEYTLRIREVLDGLSPSASLTATSALGEWCNGPLPVSQLQSAFLIELIRRHSKWNIAMAEELFEDVGGDEVVLPLRNETIGLLRINELITMLQEPQQCGRRSELPEDDLRRLISEGIVASVGNDWGMNDPDAIYCVKGLRLEDIRKALRTGQVGE